MEIAELPIPTLGIPRYLPHPNHVLYVSTIKNVLHEMLPMVVLVPWESSGTQSKALGDFKRG